MAGVPRRSVVQGRQGQLRQAEYPMLFLENEQETVMGQEGAKVKERT